MIDFLHTIDQEQFAADLETVTEERGKHWANEVTEAVMDAAIVAARNLAENGSGRNPEENRMRLEVIGETVVAALQDSLESCAEEIRGNCDDESQAETDAENLAIDTAARIQDINSGGGH
ncbi:MAG: hypothetical protein COA78_06800 [Blastopirellula sp.]|nr:MAG: hypothetical protein COA78_06800 [Blastopirellula sp.]